MLISFINYIGTIDLGSIGTKCTWSNNIIEFDIIYQQIDQVIASPSWVYFFPNVVVINLPKFISNYNLIMLKFNGFREPNKHKSFRFMHMWFRENSCLELIHDF